MSESRWEMPTTTGLGVEYPSFLDDGKKQWKEIKSTGRIPLGRIGHSICDDGEGNLYLWGGVNETIESGNKGTYLDDFFKYDFHAKIWSEIPLVGTKPVPRAFHSAVCYQDKVIIFGGCNGKGRFDDINTIETATGHCDIVNIARKPQSRYCHTAITYQGKMLVFGGKCGGRNSNRRLADMFEYNFATKQWNEVEAAGTPPSSRSAHTSVVYGKKMLVFGGRDGDGHCCEDFHEFHLEAKVWRRLDCTHPILMRARHSAVVHGDSIVIFGGWSGKKKLNDLCMYNLDTNKIRVIHDNDENDSQLPCRRECHTTVVVENQLVLFGGRFRGIFMNDSFEYPLPPPSLKFLLRNWFVDNGVKIPEMGLPSGISSSINDYKKRFVDPPRIV
eukprot:TRINITY_DN21368_c0_g1_i1.p1 TRINITY_DN21368_c0_g1~~TRINITY_DN21368_c0_g1_i1.p1  ORF type:complete len:387 (+),score=91.36 TRINITY_DN21368_c0_g1_i1:309-1469(+)